MLLIGMKVKVERKRKQGQKGRTVSYYQEGKIKEMHKNFVVVEFPKGYRECFRRNEIVLG